MRLITILVLALMAAPVTAQEALDLNWGEAGLQQADVSGYAFNYVETGDGAPVVLVHGALSDYRYWQHTVAAGASRYRMIAYSQRGFYPNVVEESEAVQSAWTDVDDLEGFIEALDVGPVHLVGHSSGGHTALLLTIRRPDLVRSLVLEEGGFVTEGSAKTVQALASFPPIIGQYIQMYAAGDVEAALTVFLDSVLGEGGFAALPDAIKQSAFDNAHTMGRRANPPLTCAQAGSVRVPTLVILGGRTPQDVQDFMSGLKDCLQGEETATIAGVSHDIHTGQPQAFNTLVFKFLEKQ